MRAEADTMNDGADEEYRERSGYPYPSLASIQVMNEDGTHDVLSPEGQHLGFFVTDGWLRYKDDVYASLGVQVIDLQDDNARLEQDVDDLRQSLRVMHRRAQANESAAVEVEDIKAKLATIHDEYQQRIRGIRLRKIELGRIWRQRYRDGVEMIRASIANTAAEGDYDYPVQEGRLDVLIRRLIEDRDDRPPISRAIAREFFAEPVGQTFWRDVVYAALKSFSGMP